MTVAQANRWQKVGAWLSARWKAVGGFLAVLIPNAAIDLTKSGTVWPATAGDWARWAVMQLAGTVIVYGMPANKTRPRPRRRRRVARRASTGDGAAG